MGPPTIPKRPMAALRIPGTYFIRNTRPKLTTPKKRETSLEMIVFLASEMSRLQPSWSRSVMQTADRLLRPLLTVLRAPLQPSSSHNHHHHPDPP